MLHLFFQLKGTSSPSLLKLMSCFNYRADGLSDTWLINFTHSRWGWLGRVLGCNQQAHCKCIISHKNGNGYFKFECRLLEWDDLSSYSSLSFFQGGFELPGSPRDGDRFPQIGTQQTKGRDCPRQSSSPGGFITRGGFTLKAIKETENSGTPSPPTTPHCTRSFTGSEGSSISVFPWTSLS